MKSARLAIFALLLSGCGHPKVQKAQIAFFPVSGVSSNLGLIHINITVTLREAPNGKDIATQSCYGMSQCVMTLDGHEILVTVSP